MCGNIRRDMIRNKVIGDHNVGVTSMADKMREKRPRLFERMNRRYEDEPVTKCTRLGCSRT